MKQATYTDAVAISHYFDGDVKKVWEIIKGKKFSAYSALKMEVHMALLEKDRDTFEHLRPGGGQDAYSGMHSFHSFPAEGFLHHVPSLLKETFILAIPAGGNRLGCFVCVFKSDLHRKFYRNKTSFFVSTNLPDCNR